MIKCAVLLSGGINKQYNEERYKNDLEFAYKVLLEDCGYEKENIKCLFADGKLIFYNQEEIKTYQAKKGNFRKILEHYAENLCMEDVFTLVVSNHGGQENGGCIYLWGNEFISLSEIADLLNQMKAKKNLILGECYAGNILDKRIENACVVAANERGCVSYGSIKNSGFDEFLLHFFAYIHRAYPDGTQIPYGGNDIRKAHQYVLEHNFYSPFNPNRIFFGATEVSQIQTDFKGQICL